jgi:hypothetical protein
MNTALSDLAYMLKSLSYSDMQEFGFRLFDELPDDFDAPDDVIIALLNAADTISDE